MGDDLVKRLEEEAECYRGTTQACLLEAKERIEQLERLLEQRDSFIVKNDLWHDFVATLGEKKDGQAIRL
jgi:hypothetical protein